MNARAMAGRTPAIPWPLSQRDPRINVGVTASGGVRGNKRHDGLCVDTIEPIGKRVNSILAQPGAPARAEHASQ